MDSSGLGKGPAARFCEHGNKPRGSIKGVEFLGQLNDFQVDKKESAP
jgi:hypothetical protein